MTSDQTNWGTVAIAGAAFYALYLFFGKEDKNIFGTSSGSGTLGNTYTERIYNYESVQRDKYLESLTNTQKESLTKGIPIDTNTNRVLSYNPYSMNSIFTNTKGNLPITSSSTITVRAATPTETTSGNSLLTLSKSSALGAKVSNVIGGSSPKSGGVSTGFKISNPTSTMGNMVITKSPAIKTSTPFTQKSYSRSRGYLSTL